MKLYRTNGTIETLSEDTDQKSIVGDTPRVMRLLDNRYLLARDEGEPNPHFTTTDHRDDLSREIIYPYVGDVIIVSSLISDFIKRRRLIE
jgi:hypothetical protein